MPHLQPISLINPVLEDKALEALQSHLEDSVHWLDHAYGRAYKLAETRDNRIVYFPAIPSNDEMVGTEYFPLWPNEQLGNFTFFDLRDEQVIEEWGKRNLGNSRYRFGASLICSFDLRNIYSNYWYNNTVSNVVGELNYYISRFASMGITVEIERWFVNTENVYRSYTHNEVKNQFNMRPYGCCRIDLQIRFNPSCLEGNDGGGLGIGYDVIEGGQVVYPE